MKHDLPRHLPTSPLALDAVIPWLEAEGPSRHLRRARWLLSRRRDLRSVPRVQRWVRHAVRGRQGRDAQALQRMLSERQAARGLGAGVQIVPCSVSWEAMSVMADGDEARRCEACSETVTRVQGLEAAAAFVGRGCVVVDALPGEDTSSLYTVDLVLSGQEEDEGAAGKPDFWEGPPPIGPPPLAGIPRRPDEVPPPPPGQPVRDQDGDWPPVPPLPGEPREGDTPAARPWWRRWVPWR